MKTKAHSHAADDGGGSQTDRASHLTDHHEYRDLNFKAIWQFLLGLAVIVAISYVSMYGIFKLFESQYAANDLAPAPTAQVEWEAPAIDVQTAPHADLVEYERRKMVELESSSPATRKLSIDQAIEATLNDGLPYRAGPPATPSAPATDNNAIGSDAGETAVETDTERNNNAVGEDRN